MGTSQNATAGPLLALSGSLMIVEIIIVLAIVALLAAVLVLYRRQNAPAKPSNAAPNPQNYYSNVETL
jgi:flagellar basal body-associated protein FliL